LAAKRKQPASASVRRTAREVRVQQVTDEDAWEFLHPRCALDRVDDLDEVQQMLSMGETEIAQEELRWLLSDCPDLMAAHQLLGEMALEAEDYSLARGHFGHAYRVGLKALRDAGRPAPLPYGRKANKPFFESGKGLIFCLKKLDKQAMAVEVADLLLACDRSDPLGVKELLTA